MWLHNRAVYDYAFDLVEGHRQAVNPLTGDFFVKIKEDWNEAIELVEDNG